jgi:hypothetical protein
MRETEDSSMAQEELFTAPPKLTEYQELVYRLLHEASVSSEVAGHAVHVFKGCRFCRAEPPAVCQYAQKQGRQILEALQKKELVARKMPSIDGRRREVWTLREGGSPATRLTIEPVAEVGSLATDAPPSRSVPDPLHYNEFPEGF